MFNTVVTIKPKSSNYMPRIIQKPDNNVQTYSIISQHKVSRLAGITTQFACDRDGIILSGCVSLYDILSEAHIYSAAKAALGEEGMNAITQINNKLDSYGIYGNITFKLMCDDDDRLYLDFSTMYLLYGSGAALLLIDLFKDGVIDISTIESMTTTYQTSYWHFNHADDNRYITESLAINFK